MKLNIVLLLFMGFGATQNISQHNAAWAFADGVGVGLFFCLVVLTWADRPARKAA